MTIIILQILLVVQLVHLMMMMMMMMMMMNCFCGIVDRAGFEPAQNLSSAIR